MVVPVPPPWIFRVPVIVSGANVNVPPTFVIALLTVSPLNEVADEVANVIAPVC